MTATAYDLALPAAQKWRKSDNTTIDAIDDFWGAMTGGDTVASLLARPMPAALGAGGGLKVDGSGTPIPATDSGPAWTPVRLPTQSADMTTAAAITGAPTSGKTIYADDLLISSDTAMKFTIQMETSANVLAAVYVAAGGTAQITLRDGLLADAINKRLFGKASVAGNVAIYACWHSV